MKCTKCGKNDAMVRHSEDVHLCIDCEKERMAKVMINHGYVFKDGKWVKKWLVEYHNNHP